ncbi:MAG: glycoside hydrolase family 57 protein [Phycisphaerae bacterium]|nr:glycoside hydrolase family 57 protein [Phycisphaerae bacterium]
MASVCFYFQVHQPNRLRRYSVFDKDHNYFDDYKNAKICRKVAGKCYLPANRLMLKLIERHQGQFKIAYSLTGTVLDQFEAFSPEVISTFHALAQTGCVEFLAETYYHSLSFLYSKEEFTEQVEMHKKRIMDLFGQEPNVFRDTELIYNNDVATWAKEAGFKGVVCEGADHILGYRSPNFLYTPPGENDIRLLLKNYRLSDDIAFRFSNQDWPEWPLTATKFSKWVSNVNGCGHTVNLFMDYETFGEHQWEDTGIFKFMEHLPQEVLRHPDNNFMLPSEVIDTFDPVGEYDVPWMTSWADVERDLSAWLGNAMQSNALHELYQLEKKVKDSGDPDILSDWRKLQTSDHFYYMCTKWFADGDVHKYFNPYDSPYDSYINFMNVLDNLQGRCRIAERETAELKDPSLEHV